ncbi:deoxyribodipyrimidine photo-lyase [Tianweitania sp. BSSL-BM11]|uniref:Deoxyribodipyrimidine photo-lyase n=1 Tax=Tianweitania aestuarii TaxID=2814886 RepID=A0ABS5RYI7_9HYPH|nr:deoxyribodipyrimidine photo-lyase [Tianweitania aestuarii]MBS9722115.1 deoxyribodipyrimidine photo-lyase [Tianweitania aestuarii]
MTIDPRRIRVLKDAPDNANGRYVLYLLQQANRAYNNPALELAIEEANHRGLPVVACFGLLEGSNGFPEANARHYAFLLDGLCDAANGLAKRDIGFVMRKCSPAEIAIDLAEDAALLVLDRGYLGIQKTWYAEICKAVETKIVQVEGDVAVPVELASSRHEFAARTFRPKISPHLDDFLSPLTTRKVKHPARDLDLKTEIDISDPEAVLASMTLDRSVPPVKRFKGGETEARRRLKAFLAGPFEDYGDTRGKPEAGSASHMSPYLHFGQISPVEIVLAAREAKASKEDKSAFVEEVVVRRELAMNHVFYTENYGSYDEAVPEWARETLADKAGDKRPHHYTDRQLANGETHDHGWNVAMKEMRETGYMHNHLRMYWGKKILEWSKTPKEGFERTLRLNNRFFLDGRDPNSFTNVAWIYGLHDRPWVKRPVFGTVRYQNENSLRKFNFKAYEEDVERLCAAENGQAAAEEEDEEPSLL